MIGVAVHAHLAAVLAVAPPPTPANNGVPDPNPSEIPGLGPQLNMVLGWGKWLAMIFGVGGLIACGIMMTIGRRNRHSFAADGAAGIPWVLAGLTLVSLSSGLVGMFLHP